MPATNLQIGTTIRKLYNGREYEVVVTLGGFRMDGINYNSLTAVAKAIKQDGRSVNGWDFFGLENPNKVTRTPSATSTTPTCKGKCQREGCYEPADCKHGFCHQHCTHGHSLGSYSSRKYPRTNELHVGVEIEVKYPNQTAFRRGLPLDGHQDGSLGSYGAEYKLLGKATTITEQATELVEELWKRGARVDKKCGIHVHLDIRQLSGTRRMEMLSWLKRTQETWFNLMPPSRRNNMYVSRINGCDNHYTWAHQTNYQTVEIRLHGGTLNPFKIAGWLSALVHLQAKANDANYAFPNTGDAEADFWSLFDTCPREGKEYLKTRQLNAGVIGDHAFRHIEE